MLGWSSQLGNKLFGQDPKLEFRKPGQGADLLAGSITFEIDDPYWTQYLTLFDTPSESLYLLPTSVLLQTLHQNPTNLLTLLSFTTNHLFQFLSNSNSCSSVSVEECLNCIRVLTRLLPLLLGPQTDNRVRDRIEEQVLWKKERRVTNKKKKKEENNNSQESGDDGQFVIEDEDDDEEEEQQGQETTTPKPQTSSSTEEEEEFEEVLPCLAEKLIATLTKLLFVPGLTLPSSVDSNSESSTNNFIVNYSIWEPGIASPRRPTPSPPPPTAPFLLSNRSEILRLLILVISLPSLLTPPNLFTSVHNRFRSILITGQTLKLEREGKEGDEKKVILCLLCSLINTVCSQAPLQDQQELDGGGCISPGGGAEGGLRASATRFAVEAAKRSKQVTLGGGQQHGLGGDVKEELIGNCLQFLSIVLIDHATPSPSPSPSSTPEENLFSFYFSKLHRSSDFSLLFNGLTFQIYSTLLSSSSTTSILPLNFNLPNLVTDNKGVKGSSSGWIVESLTMIWRLLEGNKKFLKWILTTKNKIGELIGLVEVVRNEFKSDETQIGLIRLCSFLLQTLTAEAATLATNSKEYEEYLKESLNGSITGPGPGSGEGGGRLGLLIKRQIGNLGISQEGIENLTLIEYLITSAHSLILSPATNKSGRLSTLYPSIILTIDNVSPFVVGLSLEASTRLTRIWLAFSAPSWVLMEEGNPRLIFYLLETFNNILYSNLASNCQLVYSLLQTQKRFELLSTFTLETGVTEARRLRAERRKKRQEQQSLSSVPEEEGGGGGGSSLLSPRAPIVSPRLSISSPSAAQGDEIIEGGGGVSEKVQGKRRERSLSSATLGGGLGSLPNMSELSLIGGSGSGVEEEMGQFVGKNGFVPTEGWVASWREGLPLDPILILISELSPQLSSLTRTQSLSLLRSLTPTLPSLLPSPPTRKPRRFLLNEPLQTWLASTVYGKIYLTNLEYLRETLPVQLFAVQSAPSGSGNGARMSGLGGLGGEVSRTVEGVVGGVGEFAKGFLGRVGGR